MKRTIALGAAAAALACGVWIRSARSQAPRQNREAEYLSSYRAEPGGTLEENLWQVLVLFGAGDRVPAAWDGTLAVTNGEIFQIDGYRTEPPDRILPQGGWRISTKLERVVYGSQPIGQHRCPAEMQVVPKGLLLRGAGSAGTRIEIQTAPGACAFTPMAMSFDAPVKCGRIEVRRLPPATDLSGTDLRQHDFPAIGSAPDGTLWTAWASYHDRREELNFRQYRDGRWTRLIPVGRASADLWRPQVLADETNRPWLIWSQQRNGNWDIYAMPWEATQWGALHRLSDNPQPDIEPHAVRAADGAIYVVWQSLVGRYSHVRLKCLRQGKWSETVEVTSAEANDWEPSVAATPDGAAWIAWDRYNSSYDIYCRSYSPGKGLSPERKVAGTNRMEAYASVAVDPRGRPWVAWETGAVNWGKDLGAALGAKSPGSPLGGLRQIEVACLDGQQWKAPAAFEPRDTLAIGSTSESRPMLFFDSRGSLWMAFQRRFSRQAYRGSVFWEWYLARLDGGRWSEPVPLPDSWGRKSMRVGLAEARGRLWAFWPSERRRWAFAPRPISGRVLAGSLPLPPAGPEPQLAAYAPAPDPAPPAHPEEVRNVAAMRAHRVTHGAETLRIVRGDLHRHTELSQDEGGLDDGSLPECYRYMIDAAAMDFGASTDHQAGGTDYWNFMTQKMADMYLFPQRFVPLYAYERNVGNPHGHRNILHARREYPIVPFFQAISDKFMLPDTPDGELLTFNSNSFGGNIENDTKLLYEELRKSGGLAIPHTSATSGMGTDWRDNDPKLDPVVEIYQGDRQNYEAFDTPRGVSSAQKGKAIGGFQEPGLVWNAWKKGYRLGVIASSDHFSTHMSYAMVYTPRPDRDAIFEAIRKRHTYGATDNIVLEFWLGPHFMGDDVTAAKKEPLRVKVRGTGVIEAVHLIRDARYIHKAAPGSAEVDFEYMDNEAGPGEHWYYVRAEQQNGELAWSSPIWVRYR